MFPDLTSITAILALGVPLLIVFMLLPAILELKKPKDGGPRRIMDNISEAQIQIMRTTRIVNIENEQRFDNAVIQPLSKIIVVLPNLEA